MKSVLLLAACMFLISGCASKAKIDDAMIEKYPFCYHKLMKIVNKCIDMNEAGKKTTALELENAAYPGQYSN